MKKIKGGKSADILHPKKGAQVTLPQGSVKSKPGVTYLGGNQGSKGKTKGA